jgi:hypothetical protein
MCLQAFVSEGLKPFIDTVVTFGMGHFYVSQSDKGGIVFGGDIDGYNSYAQRGNLPIVEDVMSEMVALFPGLARVRCLRSWGGIMDMSMDGSPIITTGPLPGMYLNCGWCYGGFKATPASGFCFAHTIAKDEPHELNAPSRSTASIAARHRRQGPGRDAEAALNSMPTPLPVDHLSLLRPARRLGIHLSGRRQPYAPRSGVDRPGAPGTNTSTTASTSPGDHNESGSIQAAAARIWPIVRNTLTHERLESRPSRATGRPRMRRSCPCPPRAAPAPNEPAPRRGKSGRRTHRPRAKADPLHLRRPSLFTGHPATRWPRRCWPTASRCSAARSNITARAA